jgi:hypothetical protein
MTINRKKIKAMYEEAGKRLNWVNIKTDSVLKNKKFSEKKMTIKTES